MKKPVATIHVHHLVENGLLIEQKNQKFFKIGLSFVHYCAVKFSGGTCGVAVIPFTVDRDNHLG